MSSFDRYINSVQIPNGREKSSIRFCGKMFLFKSFTYCFDMNILQIIKSSQSKFTPRLYEAENNLFWILTSLLLSKCKRISGLRWKIILVSLSSYLTILFYCLEVWWYWEVCFSSSSSYWQLTLFIKHPNGYLSSSPNIFFLCMLTCIVLQ